jgi:hypothetical protein
MNSSKRSRSTLKPLVVAVALSLPGAAALAEDMSQVVTTRADQNISQQYGRDSVYAFSNDAKPFKPEQTESRHTGWLNNAWDKTKSYTANAWHRTEGLFSQHGTAAANPEPQRYGRAGGYVGADRIAMLQTAPTVAVAPEDSTVKTGEAQDVAPQSNPSAVNDFSAQVPPAARNDMPDQMAPAPMTEEKSPAIEEGAVANKPDDAAAAAPNDYTPNQGVSGESDVVRSPGAATDNGRGESHTADTQGDLSDQVR